MSLSQIAQKTASPIHTSLCVRQRGIKRSLLIKCYHDPVCVSCTCMFCIGLVINGHPLRYSQERHFHLCASSAQETGDEANCASGSQTSLWHTRHQAVQHYAIMRNAFLNSKRGSHNVDLTQRLFLNYSNCKFWSVQLQCDVLRDPARAFEQTNRVRRTRSASV